MKILITTIAILGFLQLASAEETISEKVTATANTGKRKVTKVINRTSEALCGKLTGDSKIKCLAKEAKNRVSEGVTTVTDKASELKNSVDSDKK